MLGTPYLFQHPDSDCEVFLSLPIGTGVSVDYSEIMTHRATISARASECGENQFSVDELYVACEVNESYTNLGNADRMSHRALRRSGDAGEL